VVKQDHIIIAYKQRFPKKSSHVYLDISYSKLIDKYGVKPFANLISCHLRLTPHILVLPSSLFAYKLASISLRALTPLHFY